MKILLKKENLFSAVSHIPQSGDAVSHTGDVDLSAGMCISKGND
jgi:hypothetical protein